MRKEDRIFSYWIILFLIGSLSATILMPTTTLKSITVIIWLWFSAVIALGE